jgi:hypothetical protein
LVRRNQQLVRLKDETPCEVSLEVLTVKPGDDDALRRLFSGWGFRTLLSELEQARPKAADFFNGTGGGGLPGGQLSHTLSTPMNTVKIKEGMDN